MVGQLWGDGTGSDVRVHGRGERHVNKLLWCWSMRVGVVLVVWRLFSSMKVKKG